MSVDTTNSGRYYNYNGSTTDDRFNASRDLCIYRASQVIEFNEAVVYDSISLVIGETIYNYANFTYTTNDIDYDATQRCKLVNSGNDTLWVTRVSVNNADIAPTTNNGVSVYLTGTLSYATFEAIPSKLYSANANQGVEYTPALIQQLIDEITQLQCENRSVTSLINRFTAISTDSALKSVDLLSTNPNNKITDEVHTISTSTGNAIIFPNYGEFYESTNFKITRDDIELARNVDYELMGLDFERTKLTHSREGIYSFIYIKTPTESSNVKVTYQAFGGTVSPNDYQVIKSNINDLKSIILSNKYLTENTLPNQAVFQSISNRLAAIENYLNQFPLESFATNIAAGGKVAWYPIAYTSNVSMWPDGSNTDRNYSGYGTFEITTSDHLFFLRFATNFSPDVTSNSDIPQYWERGFTIQTLTSYTLSNTSLNVFARVVWVKSSAKANAYGAVLLLGIQNSSDSILTSRVFVNNCSGLNTAWTLYPTTAGTRNPCNRDNDSEVTPTTDAYNNAVSRVILPVEETDSTVVANFGTAANTKLGYVNGKLTVTIDENIIDSYNQTPVANGPRPRVLTRVLLNDRHIAGGAVAYPASDFVGADLIANSFGGIVVKGYQIAGANKNLNTPEIWQLNDATQLRAIYAGVSGYVPLSHVKSFKVIMYDKFLVRKANTGIYANDYDYGTFEFEIPVGGLSGAYMFYPDDLCVMRYQLYPTKFYTNSGNSNSYQSPYYQVIFNFDLGNSSFASRRFKVLSVQVSYRGTDTFLDTYQPSVYPYYNHSVENGKYCLNTDDQSDTLQYPLALARANVLGIFKYL